MRRNGARTTLSLLLCAALAATAPAASPAAGSEPLRADRVKALARKDPRAAQAVEAAERHLAADPGGQAASPALARRRQFLDQVIMAAGQLSEERAREATDIIAAMAGPVNQLDESDLGELRARYARLCARLDDQIFVRDLESVLALHDRFLRHTALALWNKAQIEGQLKRMEDAFERAPPIPFGRSELLRALRDRRLAPPAKGCYIGVWSKSEPMLSPDRLAVSVIEESTGFDLSLEGCDFLVESQDGKLVDMDTANHPASGLPFSPPLTLWMKARLSEGHIPAVNLRLAGRALAGEQGRSSGAAPLSVADVASGKIDDYLKRNLKLLAEMNAAVLLGLFGDFDRDAAATAFGADGRTPYYLLADPKTAKLSQEEIEKRLARGALTRDAGAPLRTAYGDPSVPDGPERVRDAWKRVRKLADEAGGRSLALFSSCGAFHGNKKALAQDPDAGAQDWNRLEFYWPGERVLDWLATSACGPDQVSGKVLPSLAAAVNDFILQARGSNWNGTPIMLTEAAPLSARAPDKEAEWLTAACAQELPANYPDVKAFLLDFPDRLTLGPPEAHSALRKYAFSSPYFKLKLRTQAAPP